jgi:hypothetical protein
MACTTEGERDDGPVQEKRKADKQGTSPYVDELPNVDDCKLEGTENCQVLCHGQNPYDESVKLLAATGDGEPETLR